MFGIFPRLGEVSVSALEKRVLIAVAQLLRQGKIPGVLMFFAFGRTLGAVGIILGNLLVHDVSSQQDYSPGRAVVETPSFFSRSLACSASFERG